MSYRDLELRASAQDSALAGWVVVAVEAVLVWGAINRAFGQLLAVGFINEARDALDDGRAEFSDPALTGLELHADPRVPAVSVGGDLYPDELLLIRAMAMCWSLLAATYWWLVAGDELLAQALVVANFGLPAVEGLYGVAVYAMFNK